MKKINKTVAVLLTVSMLVSLGACQDKGQDEVMDLAEEVAKYTVDRNYSKLSKLAEDGDEDLEAIFDEIEDDGYREVIASTLEYEIDEDSLEKDGSSGYTVDVTFTYVDYEEVLDDEDIFSVDDFEDAVDDCDEVVEVTITLEFEKDGSDIIFTNIEDLEDLFPYWDEDFGSGVEVIESDTEETESAVGITVTPVNPADTNQTTTSDTDPTETTYDSWADYELGGVWDDERYPDPEPYLIEGEQYLLPNTNLLFTVPDDAPVDSWCENGVDSCFFMVGGYWGNTWEDYYSIVDGTHESCFSEAARERHFSDADYSAECEPGYVSHELSTLEVTYCGVTYEGVLATITRANGEIVYQFEVLVGNEDFYYIISIRTRNMDDIINFGQNFTIVDY